MQPRLKLYSLLRLLESLSTVLKSFSNGHQELTYLSIIHRQKDLHQLRRNGGICLTSYGIIVNNVDPLSTDPVGREFIWDYVMLDKGHKMKNQVNKCAKVVHSIRGARNCIVLSGTPLMNNLEELSIMSPIEEHPQFLGKAKTHLRWCMKHPS